MHVAPNETPTPHHMSRVHGQGAVSQSEPLRDPSPPGVEFLPLLLVLHELLLHLLHGALRGILLLFWKDVWEGERLPLGQLNVGYFIVRLLNLLVEMVPLLVGAKLYPGADCSYRDAVDLLQVVLYVTLGHFHWDAKLDSVRRLLYSGPHQSQEPAGSEDPQLRVSQLVERV